MKQFASAKLAPIVAALLLGTTLSVHADDTEVYLDSGRAVNAPPVIMFYTEYDPNLASSASDSDTGINPCNNLLTDGSDLATACPDFAGLGPYFVHPNDPGASTYNNDFTDGSISQYEVIRAALKRTLIGLGNVKVGFMMTHADSSNCAGIQPASNKCSNGAYVLQAAVQLADVATILTNNSISTFDPTNATHISAILNGDPVKAELFRRLNAFVPSKGTVKATNQMKEVYFELFRYLSGRGVYNGFNGWDDFNSVHNQNIGDSSDTFSYTPSPTIGSVTLNTEYMGWDTAAINSSTYRSPFTRHCQRAFMVNLILGGNNINDNQSDVAINADMGMAVRNGTDGLVDMVGNLRGADLSSTFADPQNVTSFFVSGAGSVTSNPYDGAAAAGGSGKAIRLTFNPSQLVNRLESVLNQILSVSTTFVAASIPVNVFNRSEVIDNAYVALFQANGDGHPAWVGDVKKLKLRIGTDPLTGKNKLEFIDANSAAAISAIDGRILTSALTFWTNRSGYDVSDTPLPSVTGNDPPPARQADGTYTDGRAVMRGGSGQQIPGFLNGTSRGTATWNNSATGARRLYTEYFLTSSIPTNHLMDIQWSNIAYLYPFIRGMSDTTYSNNLWPAITNATGGTAAYTGGWTTTEQNYNISPAGDCYTFSTSSSTAAASTAKNGCQVKDLVSNVFAYMRGYDVNATASVANQIPGLRLNTRRWIMGDPLHSRPLPINYGARSGYSSTNPDIRIIFGSNDGYLRMLKNTSTATTSNDLGTEVWAFMPLEVMKTQKQLMDNEIVTSTSPNPRHPYGVDGTPVGYIRDGDGTIGTCTELNAASPCNDQVLVFFGLRRGGRAYYAMDLTDPDSPVLKWKITNISITTSSSTNFSSTDFEEMGYTFSTPVVRHMNWGQGVKPVLIFGGGYDPNKDLHSLGTNDTKGRAIYIVNANDGTLVWKATGGVNDTDTINSTNTIYFNADMDDSIPSEVTATDNNGDGLVDRVYVGDTGGRVWRVDLPNQSTTGTSDPRGSWIATKLMDVGRHNTNTLANDRRFFNAPDVVPTKDTSNFDAVVIGSGNREWPLGTVTSDYLFVYKDRAISGLLPSTFVAKNPDNFFDLTTNCIQMNTCSTASFTSDQLEDFNTGWKLGLTDTGEKSLAAATTLRGVIYFSTYVPATAIDMGDGGTASCKPEGKGYFYAISLDNAKSIFNFNTLNENTGVVMNTADRRREMTSGGIPAENVYVSFRQGNQTYTGILPSDLNATNDLGGQQWHTFWYEKNR